jgi:PAS domain S-box-containing protein
MLSRQDTTLMQIIFWGEDEQKAFLQQEFIRQGLACQVEKAAEDPFLLKQVDGHAALMIYWNEKSLDGAERLLDELHQNRQDIPVILITDVALEAEAVRLVGKGARDYLIADRLSRLSICVERARKDAESSKPVSAQKTGTPYGNGNVHDFVVFPDENPYPVMRVGRDGLLMYANRSSHPILSTWGAVVGEPLPDAAYSPIAAAVRQREYLEIEYDTDQKVFSLFVVPIRDHDYSNIYGRDITNHRSVERSLRESLEWSRAVFEAVKSGIIVLELMTGKILRVNTAALSMSGYHEPELYKKNFYDLIYSEDQETPEALVERLKLDQVEFDRSERRLIHHDGSLIWCQFTFVPLMFRPDFGICLVDDIREARFRNEEIQLQVKENLKRTEELELIVSLSSAMRQVESRSDMMDVLIRQSIQMMDAAEGGLVLLDGNDFILQKGIGRDRGKLGKPILADQNFFWRIIQAGEPFFVDDVQHIPAPRALTGVPADLGAVVFLPLKSGDIPVGVLLLGYYEPQKFTATQRRLASTISDMAGNALHRMSISDVLTKLVRDRSQELETIYKVTAAASSGDSDPAASLERALKMIINALHLYNGVILLVNENDNEKRIRVYVQYNMHPFVLQKLETTGLEDSLEGWVLTHRQPLIIPDLAIDERLAEIPWQNSHYSFAALPMRVGDRLVGILELGRPGTTSFDLEELTLMSFMADHLGLVIENASLMHKAEQHAVLEERSRLGRELHDSITQLLYSATLFAEGSRRWAEQGDLVQIQDNLVKMSQVTQQALKEMRLMVYELRSPGLQSSGLVSAIRQRLNSVEQRSGIRIELDAPPSLPEIPPQVEEALYRIAIEALNNSLKHAGATQVKVRIRVQKKDLQLQIIDNGLGFTLEDASQNGGVGLMSMRERAERLNGQFSIQTSPGAGTEIVVIVNLSGKKVGGRKVL